MRRMHERLARARRACLAGLLLFALLVAGCSSGPQHRDADAPPHQTRAAAPRLQVMDRSSVTLAKGWFPAVVQASDRGVAVLERRESRTQLQWQGRGARVTLRPRAPWVVDNYALGGPWIVWSEARGLPEDPTTPLPWRIRVLDLRTHVIRTLVRSRRDSPVAPGVTVARGKVVAGVYDGLVAGTSHVAAIDPATGRTETLFDHARAGQVVFDGRHWVTTWTRNRGAGPTDTRVDVAVLGRTGPRFLYGSGRSRGAQWSHGTLLFTSGDRVVVRNGPPYGKPRVLFQHPDPYPRLGDGIVADMQVRDGRDRVHVRSLADPADDLWLGAPSGWRLFGLPEARGHRVYATYIRRGHHHARLVGVRLGTS